MSHSKIYLESRINENLQIGKVYKTKDYMCFLPEVDYDWINNENRWEKKIYLEANSLLIFLGGYERLNSPGNSIKFLHKNKILYYHFTDYAPFIQNIKYYLKEVDCEQ